MPVSASRSAVTPAGASASTTASRSHGSGLNTTTRGPSALTAPASIVIRSATPLVTSIAVRRM